MALCLVGMTALLSTDEAYAQQSDEPQVKVLAGVLQKIRQTGVVRIGFRENAVPFSIEGADGRPFGYSIDICHAIAGGISEAIGGLPLRFDYIKVTPVDRVDLVAAKEIDFECGATTSNAERSTRVAFSPLIFVSGTKIAVEAASSIRSIRDLPGRTIAVVRGTTNEEVIRRLLPETSDTKIVATGDIPEAFALLITSKVDAVVSDDVLLQGYIAAQAKFGKRFAVVGELLSYEAYAIMFARNDPALAETVVETMRKLAESGELVDIYNKWFLQTLPNGVRLGMPMSRHLYRSFNILGLPEE